MYTSPFFLQGVIVPQEEAIGKDIRGIWHLTQGEYGGSYKANPYVKEIQRLLSISLQMSADSIIFICQETQNSTYLSFRKW